MALVLVAEGTTLTELALVTASYDFVRFYLVEVTPEAPYRILELPAGQVPTVGIYGWQAFSTDGAGIDPTLAILGAVLTFGVFAYLVAKK